METFQSKTKRSKIRDLFHPNSYSYARAVISLKTSFELFITKMIDHILKNGSLQGRRTAGDWSDADEEELWAFIGLLILAGLYKSQDEVTQSLWAEDTGQSMFCTTMSQKRFQQISLALRFDDRLSKPACQRREAMHNLHTTVKGLDPVCHMQQVFMYNQSTHVIPALKQIQ